MRGIWSWLRQRRTATTRDAFRNHLGREQPRSGDKFVRNEFGRPQAGPERERGVSIMDDANNPAMNGVGHGGIRCAPSRPARALPGEGLTEMRECRQHLAHRTRAHR